VSKVSEKILRPKDVTQRVGLSRPHLYALIKAGKFPRPVRLCGGSAVGWREATIDAWILERPSVQSGDVKNAEGPT
jgi:prophage regulatory protein